MSREKTWGPQKISSVADAIRELRFGLRVSAADLAKDTDVNRATFHRYETGEIKPSIAVLYFLLQVAVEAKVSRTIIRALAKELGSQTGQAELGLVLSVLITLEGPDALRHITRLAKRAVEILEGE